MNGMVNFGIDLGTTNSVIAKFDRGIVEVFKNPNGAKDSLPSVVGFRNNRILVGDQARAYLDKDPKNVAGRFKRKMGTTETVKLGVGSKTPVELSAFVLKELKNFVHTGEAVESVVITIPASFDTIQSNATKDAGHQAGFKQVILLQEPIAASLAYANKERAIDLRNSRWMVYDLGGGTFDVALVKIVEGELTVVDHEGDNYLGGSDFDSLLVEKIIVPELEKRGVFSDLLKNLKSETGKYSNLWHVLVSRAEEAKIELSTRTSSEIDLGMSSISDDTGTSIDALINITRSEFEEIIKPSVDGTVEMMRKILTRNSLRPDDLSFILMVGGSTLSPFVRKRVEELIGISVNTGIDPTNAIAVGAAYFAGAKEAQIDAREAPASDTKNKRSVSLKAVYNRNSQEQEEVFTAKVEGDLIGLYYRITGEDGSFDSGLKPLTKRVTEDLPLREGAFNLFQFRVFDDKNAPIGCNFESIQISQGRYSVAGQMLPDDICLVKDDLAAGDTRLEKIFGRNTVLPTRSKITVEVGRTVPKGSDLNPLRIVVVEGPASKHSSTNKQIGILEITGAQLQRDLLKGTEVDLTFDVSESRDVTCSAYLNGTGQEFSQVFKPSKRNVDMKMLSHDILQLEAKIQSEQDDANSIGNKQLVRDLDRSLNDLRTVMVESGSLSDDDVTDDRFKLENQKMKIAQEVFELTSLKRLDAARVRYFETKSAVASLVAENGNDRERHLVREILARESTFVNSNNSEKFDVTTAELEGIRFQILLRTPDFLIGMFMHLVERRVMMNNDAHAAYLIELGRKHAAEEAWESLRQVNGELWDLLPSDEAGSDEMRMYTGIV
jgi:molecular chaperone DnaK